MMWMRLCWSICRVNMRNSSSRSGIKMNWKLHRSSFKSSAITHNSLCHSCTPATFYLTAPGTNQLMMISLYVLHCMFDQSYGWKFELLLAFVMLILWSLLRIKGTPNNMSTNSKTKCQNIWGSRVCKSTRLSARTNCYTQSLWNYSQ
jgi:hypothetical protein